MKTPKVMHITLKVSDEFHAMLENAKGEEIGTYDGYVPDFFPDDHYGDYVILSLDLETGKVLNWKKPTKEQLDEFLESRGVEITFSEMLKAL